MRSVLFTSMHRLSASKSQCLSVIRGVRHQSPRLKANIIIVIICRVKVQFTKRLEHVFLSPEADQFTDYHTYLSNTTFSLHSQAGLANIAQRHFWQAIWRLLHDMPHCTRYNFNVVSQRFSLFSRLLGSIESRALINSYYFYLQGTWEFPFDYKLTKQTIFRHANGSVSNVPMMEKCQMFPYVDAGEFQVLIIYLLHDRPVL